LLQSAVVFILDLLRLQLTMSSRPQRRFSIYQWKARCDDAAWASINRSIIYNYNWIPGNRLQSIAV